MKRTCPGPGSGVQCPGATDPDRIDEILAGDRWIDDLHDGNPTDGWGKV